VVSDSKKRKKTWCENSGKSLGEILLYNCLDFSVNDDSAIVLH
jgi:hypothetical protein